MNLAVIQIARDKYVRRVRLADRCEARATIHPRAVQAATLATAHDWLKHARNGQSDDIRGLGLDTARGQLDLARNLRAFLGRLP